MADPAGRFSLAFDSDMLDPTPTWVALDQAHPNLVTSWEAERGRQFELDRTDGGRATVRCADPDGILDPTNTGGPYYGQIEPLVQAVLCRKNPTGGGDPTWNQRFRGFVSSYEYLFDPSQRVNYLQVELVDIFELLAAIQMFPGVFGDTPPAESGGQVYFDSAAASTRINQVLGNANIDAAFFVTFTLNVDLWQTVYDPGESPMTVIQEAADAEFPGVSNVYPDRYGRLVTHGRLAKFDPATVAAGAGDTVWDWHHWHAGDGEAVAASPSTVAHLREFSFSRGLASVRNSALATPVRGPSGELLSDGDVAGQLVEDATSIGKYGYRSWSAQNLLTKTGLLDSADSLAETLKFATYVKANYATPHNRISNIAFRSTRPGSTGSAITWRLMSEVDIGDLIGTTVDSPGGGGFFDTDYFVEGVRESSKPLNPDFDNDTVSLDLSPQALFTDTSMFPSS